MAIRRIFVSGALALGVLALAPAKASADFIFTPFIGGTFKASGDIGNSGESLSDEAERKLSYGASVAFLGAGIVGFEVDFGYSPNFFGADDSGGGLNLVGDGNVTTLMGNLMLSAPGPVRPYASGGVGLIKTRVDDAGQFFGEIDDSNFGFNVGGGLMALFSDNIGIRGDVRYFRSVNSNDDDSIDLSLGDFKFWRGTVGITFKF